MSNDEENYVELTDENGEVTKCEVCDIIEFEGKEYALLLPLGEEDLYDEEELIVLEYIEKDDDSYFQSIDNEEEFNKVCEYIQSLPDEADDEGQDDL